MQYIDSFFNSNFFIGLVTLIAGLVAWYVYHLNVKRRKKEAAIILIMEIRAAEKAISSFRNGADSTVKSILPHNSWERFKHLFVQDLDSDEYELVNNFFVLCGLAENALQRQRGFLDIATEAKTRALYSKLLDLAAKHSDKKPELNLNPESEYFKERDNLTGTYYADSSYYVAPWPAVEMNRIITTIEFITTTNAGGKLKSIAGIR